MDTNTLFNSCDALVLALQEISEVTEDQIARYGAKLRAPCEHETVVSEIHGDFIKRMWVVRNVLLARVADCKNRIENGALSPAEDAQVQEEANRSSMLREIIDNLMFYQLRQECGAWSLYVGLRADWKIVTAPADHGMPRLFNSIFGGL